MSNYWANGNRWISAKGTTPPIEKDVLVTDGSARAVAFLDCYLEWHRSDVSTTYDMDEPVLCMNEITHWRMQTRKEKRNEKNT